MQELQELWMPTAVVISLVKGQVTLRNQGMLNVMSQKRKRPQMMKMHDQESVIILISENEEVNDEDGCESDNEEGEESDHED